MGRFNGRLEIITGPMFSGKSEELLRRLRRAEIAGNKVAVLKPAIDDRYDKDHVISHAGTKMPALVVEDKIGEIRTHALPYSVVGIDEGQFFRYDEFVEDLRNLAITKVVIVSGLDMTFAKEPFGQIPELLAVAERIDKLSAVCHSCGHDANYTQRLINGRPAPASGPVIQVGGLESYEARCGNCFRLG
jgi:thymidine kinase